MIELLDTYEDSKATILAVLQGELVDPMKISQFITLLEKPQKDIASSWPEMYTSETVKHMLFANKARMIERHVIETFEALVIAVRHLESIKLFSTPSKARVATKTKKVLPEHTSEFDGSDREQRHQYLCLASRADLLFKEAFSMISKAKDAIQGDIDFPTISDDENPLVHQHTFERMYKLVQCEDRHIRRSLFLLSLEEMSAVSTEGPKLIDIDSTSDYVTFEGTISIPGIPDQSYTTTNYVQTTSTRLKFVGEVPLRTGSFTLRQQIWQVEHSCIKRYDGNVPFYCPDCDASTCPFLPWSDLLHIAKGALNADTVTRCESSPFASPDTKPSTFNVTDEKALTDESFPSHVQDSGLYVRAVGSKLPKENQLLSPAFVFKQQCDPLVKYEPLRPTYDIFLPPSKTMKQMRIIDGSYACDVVVYFMDPECPLINYHATKVLWDIGPDVPIRGTVIVIRKDRIHKFLWNDLGINAPKRKRFSVDFRMTLYALQEWKCNVCRKGLPATSEIDHYIPLGCGFWNFIPVDPNSKQNLQALCPNCHAAKSMKERQCMPHKSYVPCSCGQTHSRYFKPTCKKWTKRFRRLETGIIKTSRKSCRKK